MVQLRFPSAEATGPRVCRCRVQFSVLTVFCSLYNSLVNTKLRNPSPAPPLPFRPAIGSGLQRSFQFNLNMRCESNRAAETQSSPDVMKQLSKGLSVCPKHYISQKNVDDFENVGNCVQTANSVTMTSESIIRSTDTRHSNVWREIAVLLQRPI